MLTLYVRNCLFVETALNLSSTCISGINSADCHSLEGVPKMLSFMKSEEVYSISRIVQNN